LGRDLRVFYRMVRGTCCRSVGYHGQ
jgi:hypothetical protein